MTAFRTVLSTQAKDKAMESAIEAIAISDMLGNLTYVNPALLSLWEYASIDDVLGRPIADFWVTEKSSPELLQSVLDKGTWKGELTAKRRSGAPFDVFVSASIVRDTFGAPLCLVAEFEDVSGRKRSEERIRRLSSFPELNPNPILEVAVDGKLLYANLAATDLAISLGLSGPVDFLPPETNELMRRAAVSREDGNFYKEKELGGRLFGEHFYYSAEFNSLRVYAIDVTERKRTEETNSQLSHMLDLAPGIIIIHDDAGNLLYVNQQACDAHGYTREDFLKLPLRDLVSPTDARAMDKRIATALSGIGTSFEALHIRKDGVTLPLLVNVRPSRWGNRNVLVSVCTDLTDRKLAENKLHKNELKFRSLFTSMHEGFALHELVYNDNGEPCDYVILDANPAFETITGIAPVEAMGRLATDLYGTASAPYLDSYAKVALTGEPTQFETEFAPLNKTFSISVYSPIRGQFATIFQDVTSGKKAEETARKLDKLDSLGVLAAGIAHDFNNLLNGIFGYMDLAKDSATDEKTVANIDKAFSVFSRAKDLAQQLITFSKGGDPVTSSIDVAALLHDSVLFALSGSRVSCNWDVPPGLWSCNADKNQIGQVFDNISINAREAMAAGGTLTISASNADVDLNAASGCRPGKYVCIRFRDTGPGIAAEILDRIFDPFFTTKKEGTGLGLATAFSIVKKHGGTLHAASINGCGAEFTVFLPAADASVFSDTTRSGSVEHGSPGTVAVQHAVVAETVSQVHPHGFFRSRLL